MFHIQNRSHSSAINLVVFRYFFQSSPCWIVHSLYMHCSLCHTPNLSVHCLVSAAFLSSFIDNEIALNRKRGIFKKMYDFLPVEDSSTIELVRARVSVVLSVLVVWGVWGEKSDEFITGVFLEQWTSTSCNICWSERNSYGFALNTMMLVININLNINF